MKELLARRATVGALSLSLERRLLELLGCRDIGVVLQYGGDRCSRRRAAFKNLGLGEPLSRDDAAPIVRGGVRASLAHCRDACLAVAAPAPIACDLASTDQVDREVPLSPPDRYLAHIVALYSGEQMLCAAMRVRGVRECLRKLGVQYAGPLSVRHYDERGAVVLTGAGATIASMISTGGLLISVACPEAEPSEASWDNSVRCAQRRDRTEKMPFCDTP